MLGNYGKMPSAMDDGSNAFRMGIAQESEQLFQRRGVGSVSVISQ
jgi:hypothetical protein